ncbi:hypothetical protein JXB12_09455 [candidate division KSB1 bacterium]|nr:hypothetical protein [candidate division KSB1 bacterium]
MFGSIRRRASRRYAEIQGKYLSLGMQQAAERHIDPKFEPFEIVKKVPLPGNTDGEHYWFVADYLLASYPVELALLIAASFNSMQPRVGFGPYGKIMIGAQFVDRNAAADIQARVALPGDDSEFSTWLLREKIIPARMYLSELERHYGPHPAYSKFVLSSSCSERSGKAIEFLAAGAFQANSADVAKKTWPTLIVVPEVASAVAEMLRSIDNSVGIYVTE